MQFDAYGGPEVLHAANETIPAPGPGQVRIVQHVIGVNRADVKQLAGAFGAHPHPGVLGFEAAGVIDAVGPDVEDLAVGAAVLWHGRGAQREIALVAVGQVRPLPPRIDMDQAAILPVAGATAFSAVMQVGVGADTRLLVHGASGGVGSAVVQIAIARGATVVGTASAANQEYVHSLGATPLVYGPQLRGRLHDLPSGLTEIDAVIDLVGSVETVGATVALLGGRPGTALSETAERAVTVADSPPSQEAGIAGVRPYRGALDEVLLLAAADRLHTDIAQAFSLVRAADAVRALTGHARGKIVLRTTAAE